MSKSKADQERLDAIHNMPCICCEIKGVCQSSRTEAHHLVDKGNRAASGGDQSTIPLCGWHHRGEPSKSFEGVAFRRSWMLSAYGPSLKFQGKKGGFVEKWGTERELLAKTNELLGVK